MPNRPRPVSAPKAFDVFKPGKGSPSPTSRPVIVSHQSQVQDLTLVEEHGSPIPNAHQSKQPKLQSLSSRRVAPSAHAIHHGAVPTPSPDSTPVTAESELILTTRTSHTGHIIARPFGSTATNHAALLHHKISPPREHVQPAEPAKPDELSLAAVPITPVEQPAGLENAKTEGKEELLAAVPVEIRRSVARAEGQSVADWNMSPPEVTAQTVAATPAVAPDGTVPSSPVPTDQQPAPQTAIASEQTAQPAASAGEQLAHVAQPESEVPTPLIKTDRKRSSDAIVFIIMLILFLGLGTVVALLFITGTISI